MTDSRSGTKYFTVKEANKMLPLVKSIVRDLVEKIQEWNHLHERLEIVQANAKDGMSEAHREEVEQMEAEYAQREQEYFTLEKELRSLGVDLKGPEGLVDFPALLDGREVLLCWKHGEDKLTHWHELDGGFAGRRPITPDLVDAFSSKTEAS